MTGVTVRDLGNYGGEILDQIAITYKIVNCSAHGAGPTSPVKGITLGRIGKKF